MKDYVHVYPIQVRWRDLDAFTHVNNAAFATYLEIARTELWRSQFDSVDGMEIPFFVAGLAIEFKRPIALYDVVEVGIRVGETRGASFTFEYRVEANDVLSAEAVTRQVCVDKTTGKPIRMLPALRTKLDALKVASR